MLRIAAMGGIEIEVLDAVQRELGAQFGEQTGRMRLPEPGYAYDPARQQYGAVQILRHLAAECPPGSRILGIAAGDLFIPMLTFLFGQAQLGGTVAVISLARLRQEFYGLAADSGVLMARARTEALHETGHIFGLIHCPEPACAMSLSTSIRQLDAKTAAFCPACTLRLRERRAGPHERATEYSQ